MSRRVNTGCTNCKRCTNSSVAELGRRQGKLWANLFLMGLPAMAQAFTPTCRACTHKRSLHGAARQIAPVVTAQNPWEGWH